MYDLLWRIAHLRDAPDAARLARAALEGEDIYPWMIEDALKDVGLEDRVEEFFKAGEDGDNVLLMTVTFYWVGKLKKLSPTYVILERPTFITSLGPIPEAFAQGSIRRMEVYPRSVPFVGLERSSIVAWAPWAHELAEPG